MSQEVAAVSPETQSNRMQLVSCPFKLKASQSLQGCTSPTTFQAKVKKINKKYLSFVVDILINRYAQSHVILLNVTLWLWFDCQLLLNETSAQSLSNLLI